jgi:two-component system LytT family response regulator
MINAIVIDDEDISAQSLCGKIGLYCPGIKVLKAFTRPEQALQEIEELRPDLVFLDIEMPRMNGFAFLKNCQPFQFQVVFTTAYGEYSIAALRVSALDFLMKPIDAGELMTVEKRLTERIATVRAQMRQMEREAEASLQQRLMLTQAGKITLPVTNGLEFVNVVDIIRIQGDNVYSTFYLGNGKKMVACMTLKETDMLLGRLGFFRVHKSSIVNLRHITRYIKGEGGVVVMSDGAEVEVSRRIKPMFLKMLGS